MNRKTQIAVVGAGLGGLTVAGFLQRAGFPVTIYEQAPTFSRIGAGIILSANAMKVLRRLGVEDELIRTRRGSSAPSRIALFSRPNGSPASKFPIAPNGGGAIAIACRTS